MLDKTQEGTEAENLADQIEAGGEEVAVKVTKGGTILVDIAKLPDRIYRAVIMHGLQKLINRKTKTSPTDPNERAKANLAAMYDNTYKLVGSKAESSKASGPVMVEARRLAKAMIKSEIKAGNITNSDGSRIKVAQVSNTEYTRLANELIEADPSIVKQAEANLKAAEEAKSNAVAKLKVAIDPTLVAKAEAKKAKDKATAGQTLSAKQAGKVQAKAKPQATK